MTHEHEIEQPTQFGQQILDAVCDHLAEEGFPYWVPPIASTNQCVNWLSTRLNKSNRSVAGGLSSLVAKGLMSTGWEHETGDGILLRKNMDVSVTVRGWCRWSQWSEHEMTRIQNRSLEEWLDWDGIDGTTIGEEFQVRLAELFGECLQRVREEYPNGWKSKDGYYKRWA